MIPQKIHYCWLSGDPFPPMIDDCIKTWKKWMPDFEFVLWDRNRINIEEIPWVKEAYENKKYAFAADYIRLYALYKEGGIYLDSDVEVVKDLSPLLVNKSFMGYETGGDFEPAIIGAEAEQEWVKRCLDYYKDRHFCNPDGTFNMRPLPLIVNDVLSQYYKIPKDVVMITQIEQIALTLYPAEYFSPKNIHLGRIKSTKNTYTIHHFDGTWVKNDFYNYVKNYIHKILILFLGQRLHNSIIKKIRHK